MILKQIKKQNEEGGYDVHFALTEDQTKLLVNIGINYALQRGLVEISEDFEDGEELANIPIEELHSA